MSETVARTITDSESDALEAIIADMTNDFMDSIYGMNRRIDKQINKRREPIIAGTKGYSYTRFLPRFVRDLGNDSSELDHSHVTVMAETIGSAVMHRMQIGSRGFYGLTGMQDGFFHNHNLRLPDGSKDSAVGWNHDIWAPDYADRFVEAVDLGIRKEDKEL